ncbi:MULTISPECIES: ABC transporter permease [Rhizobium]|uniref:ABC transporter permease n=1 Tax=Rhizobium rhododendri TaxID=2506430 RepID=A0ABY8IMF1_9HYPH|nr:MULTISPECIES: ABC transporter permease [Rhizobium]MBO9101054.1 ABC transporter permease [Rhizobium sp. L58/93]MBO9135388.1 ABC transporter permease [Rhizobium sp. B209b/85]MBO9186642.1 ABC transporter permease [Rhizobium sp. E27B/91]MBZ5762448.1 ABC transporter permease [Rhizobium sp. VS19-DR96]MBZ5768401.1 ABC transporter permease [Rhizobium sp. VS19-DR129.2]
MRNETGTLTSERRPSGLRSRRALPSWVSTTALLMPTYGWLTLAVFLPLLTMLVFSFMSATPMGKAPIVFTLKQYRAFIDQPYLVGIAVTSLLIGFWTTLSCAVIGFLAAVALTRSTFGKTREMLLILILLPFWTNGLVRVFSWTMVLRENGFLDTLFHIVFPEAGSIGFLYSRYAIVVGLVHGYLPYMILTCYIALVTIDEAIIEAASSLGARWWTILFKILVPMAAPGLVSGAVLTFIPVIGSFMEPRILGGRVGVTMGTVIEDQFTQAFNWPLGAALSFTLLAVVLAIFATFSGVLRRGTTA